ncbi:VanZ family protein [Streptomyces lunalinharesii]|uniref:VanZ-like domain-containing protein n=1 Tax=Streptomyces lunalinharesii TaxID=333384 RepID=A0ABN3SK45_9ACTN
MIGAAISALPGLLPAFLVLAAVLGAAATAVAKGRGAPVALSVLCAVAVAGVLVVTLLPGHGGSGPGGSCDVGLPGWAFLDSESARLNVALFVPPSFLAVLLFRRPVAVLAGCLLLAGGIELLQGTTELGRACSYDDLKANALGGCLGVLLGAVGLWAARRRCPLTRRDALRGAAAAALGGALLVGAFAMAVEPVDGEARAQQGRVEWGGQENWLDGVAADLFGGGDSAMTVLRKRLPGGGWRLTVEVQSHGSFVVRWPERRLERFAWPAGDGAADDTGALPAGRVRAVGDRFVRKWFPQVADAAEVKSRPSPDERRGHVLRYRHTAPDTAGPGALEVRVSPTGRVVELITRGVPEPEPELKLSPV